MQPSLQKIYKKSMQEPLKKIEAFLAEHHLLSLATSQNNIPYSASLFYAYDSEVKTFIVASDPKTAHIQNVLANAQVSGTVALETDEVGKIRGIQFSGTMEMSSKEDAKVYFKEFPYARVMQPQLWIIKVEKIKMTDNRLGFGKKLYWNRSNCLV